MADEVLTIEQLGIKLAQKNPDLVRDLMTSFNCQISPPFEFNQGKLIKCGEIKKTYKI
jgi:hypothetical protein